MTVAELLKITYNDEAIHRNHHVNNVQIHLNRHRGEVVELA